MTRINLVEPHQLTRQHLLAEYKEITRIFSNVKDAVMSGKTPANFVIPARYVLGKGHMKFFYNKLAFVVSRYDRLREEMEHRKYNIDREMFNSVMHSLNLIPPVWFRDYKPTPDEIYLNMCRLCKRSKIAEVLDEMYRVDDKQMDTPLPVYESIEDMEHIDEIIDEILDDMHHIDEVA